MKISVNLATLASPRERYAFAWAIPVALAALSVLVALSYSTLLNYREYHKIDDNLGTLVRQEGNLKEKETALKKDLEQPQNREMFDKAHFINSLIDQKQLSTGVLMERIAALLPPTVRLTSVAVSHQKDAIGVRLSAVGKDEDALETLMGNLEDAPDFQDLTVANQSGSQSANLSEGLVGIICTARYVGKGAE